MKFSEKYEKQLLAIAVVITLILIACLGLDLYRQIIKYGVDLSLAIITFWMSSAVLFMSIYSDSKVFLIMRSLFVFIIATISIYVSMSLKFAIEYIK